MRLFPGKIKLGQDGKGYGDWYLKEGAKAFDIVTDVINHNNKFRSFSGAVCFFGGGRFCGF